MNSPLDMVVARVGECILSIYYSTSKKSHSKFIITWNRKQNSFTVLPLVTLLLLWYVIVQRAKNSLHVWWNITLIHWRGLCWDTYIAKSEVDKLCEDSGDWHIGIIFKEPVVIDISGLKEKKTCTSPFKFLSFYSTQNKIQTPSSQFRKDLHDLEPTFSLNLS